MDKICQPSFSGSIKSKTITPQSSERQVKGKQKRAQPEDAMFDQGCEIEVIRYENLADIPIDRVERPSAANKTIRARNTPTTTR